MIAKNNLVNKHKKTTNNWFLVAVTYLTIINLFVLKTTPELIFVQFLIIILIFQKLRFKKFTQEWIPFIALFFIYEFLRGFVDNLSPFYNSTLFWMHNLEEKMFSILPSKYLQETIPTNSLVANLSLFFYSLFFYYSFFTGFIIWLKKSDLFANYFKRFMVMTFVSLAFFFLIPTAPPWFANERFNLGLERILFQDTVLKYFSTASLWNYFIKGNPVAAFPSLHVAWPAFTSLFVIKYIKRAWWSYLSLIIPFMVGFSVVYAAEHYVVDVIAGWLLALVVSTTSVKFLRANK